MSKTELLVSFIIAPPPHAVSDFISWTSQVWNTTWVSPQLCHISYFELNIIPTVIPVLTLPSVSLKIMFEF